MPAGSGDGDSAAYETLQMELNQGVRNDVIEQFSSVLRQRYPVSVNEAAMSQAHGAY